MREETRVHQERYRTGAPAGRGLYCGSAFIALFEQAAVARRTAELYNDAYGLLSLPHLVLFYLISPHIHP